jgi:hypothetical protein
MGSDGTRTATVRALDPGALEFVFAGYLRTRDLEAALAEGDALLAQAGCVRTGVVVDALAIDTFESGLPIVATRWLGGHTDRIDRLAVVTRRTAHASIARAMRYLLPTVSIEVFADLAAGRAFACDAQAASAPTAHRAR